MIIIEMRCSTYHFFQHTSRRRQNTAPLNRTSLRNNFNIKETFFDSLITEHSIYPESMKLFNFENTIYCLTEHLIMYLADPIFLSIKMLGIEVISNFVKLVRINFIQ